MNNAARQRIKQAVFERDNYICVYCCRKLSQWVKGIGGLHYDPSCEPTLDHILPKSQGGKFTQDNLVTACQDCNVKKGSTYEQC